MSTLIEILKWFEIKTNEGIKIEGTEEWGKMDYLRQ